MAYSTRCPSLNTAYTKATTFYQFFSSFVAVYVVSTASISIPAPVVTVSVPISFYGFVPSSSGYLVVYSYSSDDASVTVSTLLASYIHPLM